MKLELKSILRRRWKPKLVDCHIAGYNCLTGKPNWEKLLFEEKSGRDWLLETDVQVQVADDDEDNDDDRDDDDEQAGEGDEDFPSGHAAQEHRGGRVQRCLPSIFLLIF